MSPRIYIGSSSLQQFVNDLNLLPKTDKTSIHADDNIFYATGDCFEVITEDPYADQISLQSWFHENYMILNP